MIEQVTLQLTEIVGSTLCVASEDGQKVHEQIAQALLDGRRVQISFLNVESLTSAFLNTAIGQLYGEFPEEQLKNSLSVTEIDPTDAALLKRVTDTAKLYFRDPDAFNSAHEHVLGDGDDEEYDA